MKIDKAERICAFCEKASPLFDKDTVLCQKKGIVPKSYKCKKFSYDPIKRTPPKAQSTPALYYVDIDN